MDEKSAGGRPSLYLPEYCAKLIEHMEQGLSFEAFAGVVGVRKQTLYNWEKEFPEFLDAKEVGLGKAQVFWENLGISHIVSKSDSDKETGSKSRSLNSSVWIFNMKNRFGWRDKQPDEHDTVINNTNNVNTKSDDEITKRLAELLPKVSGE